MTVTINICPKNPVDGFCNMPIDFYRDRVWGYDVNVYQCTNVYSKVLCDKVSCT